jgi:hypothetical protein
MSHSYLLTTESAKIVKTRKKVKALQGVLNLAPANSGGTGNLCPYASKGCLATCLQTSGRNRFKAAHLARVSRTKYWRENRAGFVANLDREIGNLVKRARRAGLTPFVRLNGLSDIRWEVEDPWLFIRWRHVRFIDYTKNPHRYLRFLRGDFPSNYTLTFSRSESNELYCVNFLRAGGTVTVLFPHNRPLPTSWEGHRVIDGDLHDFRALDPKGVVVGLRAKGKAKQDMTGFVVR